MRRILLQVGKAASTKDTGERKIKPRPGRPGSTFGQSRRYLGASALVSSLSAFFSFLAFFVFEAFFSAFASFLSLLASCDMVSWANTPADKLRVRAAANNSVRSFFIVLNAPYGFVCSCLSGRLLLRCRADECPGSAQIVDQCTSLPKKKISGW